MESVDVHEWRTGDAEPQPPLPPPTAAVNVPASLLLPAFSVPLDALDDPVPTVVGGRQGDCVMHCGQQLHGAQAVTRGLRMMLVCFIDEIYVP